MENVLDLAPNKLNPIHNFFKDCSELLFAPARFFRARFLELSTSEILVLGLLSGWLASAAAFFWDSLGDLFFSSLFRDFEFSWSEDRADYLWDAGYLLAYPMVAIFRIAFSSIFLWFFARLFLVSKDPKQEINLASCLRIAGIASVGNWFMVVPVVGGIIAYLATLFLMITGVVEVFQVSFQRASLVVLLPRLLLLIAIVCIGLLLALFLYISFPNFFELFN